MSHELIEVRTLRQHDTVDGMKAPGECYTRPKAEAEQLAARGVVELVAAKAARSK